MATLYVILISSCLLDIFLYLLGSVSSNARRNGGNDCRPECDEKEKKRAIRNGWAAIILLLGIICFLSCFCAAIFKCHKIAIGFLIAGAVLMLVGGLSFRWKHGFWWW